MPVVSMSKKEFDRLEVLLGVQTGRLRVADACAQSEAASGLSVAGWFETRLRGQPGLEATRPAEQ